MLAFGLFGKLHLGLPVLVEEHDLQIFIIAVRDGHTMLFLFHPDRR